MTSIQKILILMPVTIVLIILLLFFRMFYVSILFSIVFVFLCFVWYRLMIEELILYKIMENGQKMHIDKIIDQFGEKARPAIKRMAAKKMIELIDDVAVQKVVNYKFVFGGRK
jgi:hypothetical protein